MKTLYIHGSADHYGSAKILLDILRLPGNAKDAIVVLPHDGLLVNDIKALDIPIHIINLGVLRRKYMTPWGIVGRVVLWISAIIQLRKLIHHHQIDRVYVNSANVVVGPALKQKNQTELVWHLHEIVESPVILKSFLSYLIQQADKTIAVSAATKKFWDTAMGNEKVNLLYNGLHLDKFINATADKKSLFSASNDETYLVGMVGRVQHWKGQHYFLEIIEHYFQKHPSDKQTKFILVGDPFPGYENLAIELVLDITRRKLNDRVFYTGYRADISTVLKSIDLLVLPSTSPDPLPTVVLEAMASSIPVLATAQGGAMEMVIDHVTGRFMSINDAKKSATILSELLSDKEALKKMGEAGRERVEKEFSATAFANNWNRLCS